MSQKVPPSAATMKIFDLKVGHYPKIRKIFEIFFHKFLQINSYGPKGTFLIILRNYQPVLINLQPYKRLKIQKIDFDHKKF